MEAKNKIVNLNTKMDFSKTVYWKPWKTIKETVNEILRETIENFQNILSIYI